MISLKKYKKPEIEIVLIKNDIIITSGGELGEQEITDPYAGTGRSISKMNPLDRPLGIFKRD